MMRLIIDGRRLTSDRPLFVELRQQSRVRKDRLRLAVWTESEPYRSFETLKVYPCAFPSPAFSAASCDTADQSSDSPPCASKVRNRSRIRLARGSGTRN